jgi:hypothetical protein
MSVRFKRQQVGLKDFTKVLAFSMWCSICTCQHAFGQGDDSLEPNQEVWKVTIAAEPRPALEHSFWPKLNEFKRGNAIVNYQRAYMQLSTESINDLRAILEGEDGFTSADSERLVAKCASSLTEISRATYRKEITYDVGWDQLTAFQKLQIAIPEVEHFALLGTLIDMKVQLAIADQRFEEAIDGIRAGFRCAAASREIGGTIFADLVCLRIAEKMCSQIETLIQVVDRPNLYWALASVPQELMDFSNSILLEAALWEQMAEEWSELRLDTNADVDWRERLAEVVRMLNSEKSAEALVSGEAVSEARGRVLESGLAAERIQAMSAEEVVLRALHYEFRLLQDERTKWLLLPEQIQLQHARRARGLQNLTNVAQIDGTEMAEPSYLASRLFEISAPDLTGAKANAIFFRQRFARLSTVEALSDFAARHGQWPESLLVLDRLPAWPDPVTGEPFVYKKLGPREAELTSTSTRSDSEGETIVLKLVR